MYELVFDREGGDDVENDENEHSDNNAADLRLGASLSFLKIGLHLSCFLLILAGWESVPVCTPLVNRELPGVVPSDGFTACFVSAPQSEDGRILISQGENAASAMEGDVSCSWG